MIQRLFDPAGENAYTLSRNNANHETTEIGNSPAAAGNRDPAINHNYTVGGFFWLQQQTER